MTRINQTELSDQIIIPHHRDQKKMNQIKPSMSGQRAKCNDRSGLQSRVGRHIGLK